MSNYSLGKFGVRKSGGRCSYMGVFKCPWFQPSEAVDFPRIHFLNFGVFNSKHLERHFRVLSTKEIPFKYGIEIDIMIEAKMKEKAIMKLYEKYPLLNCKKITIKKKKKS